MTENKKECNQCHKTLPTTDFNKHATSKDGLTYFCKPCTSDNNRRKYRKDRPKQASQEPWFIFD